MKYNFSPIIHDRVHAKINGIDPRQWIQGVPDAADACQQLAVQACLELYIKTCVEHAVPHAKEVVVPMLLAMGFPRGVVSLEMATGPYAAFFRPHDRHKDPVTLQVRIVRCSSASFWYADKVGQEFTVTPRSYMIGKGVRQFEVFPRPAAGPEKVISKTDFEIISF